jgi:hypothetical protein
MFLAKVAARPGGVGLLSPLHVLQYDGLTKAAENLGKVGEPVVKLAAKVMALLITD